LYYAFKETGTFAFLFENSFFLLLLTAITSWLLISPIKMMAMKFKSKKLQDNYPKIILLGGGIAILILFQIVGIPMLVIYYIIVSLVFQKQLG
jgi:CDP-diacylglycerol--serine O-phosphatidyltransferase